MKGMMIFAFAWRRDCHSPCNVRLAKAAKRVIEKQKEPILIFAQRTTASALKELGIECFVVQKQLGYEGSEELIRQATETFRKYKIKEVIPVAQPFLHLTKCVHLIQKKDFKTPSFWKLAKMIGWIGFDQLSVQPATRGPLRLIFYTILQILFSYRPPPEQSEP